MLFAFDVARFLSIPFAGPPADAERRTALARAFACIIHSQYPDKLLAYSCPPPFTGRAHHSGAPVTTFQKELAAMGYRFQSAAPAGHPAPGESSSELADRHPRNDAPAYA